MALIINGPVYVFLIFEYRTVCISCISDLTINCDTWPLKRSTTGLSSSKILYYIFRLFQKNTNYLFLFPFATESLSATVVCSILAPSSRCTSCWMRWKSWQRRRKSHIETSTISVRWTWELFLLSLIIQIICLNPQPDSSVWFVLFYRSTHTFTLRPAWTRSTFCVLSKGPWRSIPRRSCT